MFSGAWPEGTRLRIKATRDPADVDLNGQAWHTEGRTYELEVRAEDEMDRSTGVANHVRLVDCDEVHMGAPSSARQGAASMQGVFKPERLRMLNERHWQQVLRDADGHNYKERVAYLRSRERRLSRSMRAELFVPNDITSASHGWYEATDRARPTLALTRALTLALALALALAVAVALTLTLARYAATVHAYCDALAVGGGRAAGRFRVVYDVDTARPDVKGETDIDTWEDLLLLARKLYIRAEGAIRT